MSDDVRADARRLLQGITPGPRVAEYCREQGNCVIPADAQSTREAVAITRLYRQVADAEFIAAAPTLVDRLLAELDQALAERDQALAERDQALATLEQVRDDLPERVDEQYTETLAVAKAIYESLPSEDPDCGVEPWEQLTDDQRAPFLTSARNLGHVFPDQYTKLAAELDQYRAAQVAERKKDG
ncbi:hypothetical protein SEA_LAHIRIUM_78 [Gordonia phage Lahirium]|uniref:Uncharacterized protein n=1 Tax=Gordonia phage Lahirium TaxID=2517932 RepID=A0A482J9U7_9CAUD|nr:hypothetical protein SEA_LAHIRIUM_78 [Gordonia phage Lahirium]